MVLPTVNGRYSNIKTPDNKLEMVSFSANPNANPVKPNPATRAEILIPNVPSAVTTPTIRSVILLVRANSEDRLVSNFNLALALSMAVCAIFDKI